MSVAESLGEKMKSCVFPLTRISRRFTASGSLWEVMAVLRGGGQPAIDGWPAVRLKLKPLLCLIWSQTGACLTRSALYICLPESESVLQILESVNLKSATKPLHNKLVFSDQEKYLSVQGQRRIKIMTHFELKHKWNVKFMTREVGKCCTSAERDGARVRWPRARIISDCGKNKEEPRTNTDRVRCIQRQQRQHRSDREESINRPKYVNWWVYPSFN